MSDRATELVVEMGNDRNDNIMFPPTKDFLRGRWAPAGLAAGERSRGRDPHQLPITPGLYVVVNVKNRLLRIEDPLAQEQHRETLAKLNAVLRGWGEQRRELCPTKEIRAATDEQLATWVHHLRYLVETGNARVIHGAELLDKQPPGRVKVDCFSWVWSEPKYADEFALREKYGPEEWHKHRDELQPATGKATS